MTARNVRTRSNGWWATAEDLPEAAESQCPAVAVVDSSLSSSSGTWLTTTTNALNLGSPMATISRMNGRPRTIAPRLCSAREALTAATLRAG